MQSKAIKKQWLPSGGEMEDFGCRCLFLLFILSKWSLTNIHCYYNQERGYCLKTKSSSPLFSSEKLSSGRAKLSDLVVPDFRAIHLIL